MSHDHVTSQANTGQISISSEFDLFQNDN